jgi:hypothetical protein
MKGGAVRFAGYASVFDHADRSGDVVRRGAFARAKPVGLPLLWQHDPARPVGVVERIEEDARGLRVIGRLTLGSDAGREAGALLADGAIDGLSFGYRVRRAMKRPGGGRELIDLDLLEISMVTFPMQPLARVHAVDRGN